MSQDQSTFPTNQYFPYWKKLPYLVQREVGLMLSFFERRIPFRCNTFVWHVDGLGTLPDMLDWIDKETIKTIFLHDTFCPRTHTEIKNNMTWKQAEHLYIEFSNENPGTQEIALQNTNIDWIDLSRFKNLELNITGISAKDAWKLIKAYKTCEHPRGSCIIVKSRSAIHSKRLMALFDVEVNNQPISNIPAVHTQQFSKSDQRLVLVVMIHPKHFEGIVCGVDTIKEDVQSATGGVFSKKSN
ncbi:hypothetical protein GCK72_026052 [Caenorhabditis remanei]|uniref:DUF38 domain-containing protein n=1 Tax=Caenorhabditis remanei TaxID=31234 RepID=A0A6A5G4S8_CAERE|nr:hypothetical protein GCK72_026052 [Caenorhabditis remanei]KAF1749584.1 hypothetical protein GCK72_026052 [Caenorhabditis remanei]